MIRVPSVKGGDVLIPRDRIVFIEQFTASRDSVTRIHVAGPRYEHVIDTPLSVDDVFTLLYPPYGVPPHSV
jgi:hypothetical protein